jgi:hypothetical protein
MSFIRKNVLALRPVHPSTEAQKPVELHYTATANFACRCTLSANSCFTAFGVRVIWKQLTLKGAWVRTSAYLYVQRFIQWQYLAQCLHLSDDN